MRFFENLVFPNTFYMVPSCCHQMPNGLNCCVCNLFPKFPIKVPLYPICFCPKSFSCKLYRQPKREHQIMSILGLAKASPQYHMYMSMPCEEVLFSESAKECFFFGVVAIQKAPSPNERKSLDRSHTTQLIVFPHNPIVPRSN